MITTEVISNDFVDWLRTSDSYKNNFSVQGARALYDYYLSICILNLVIIHKLPFYFYKIVLVRLFIMPYGNISFLFLHCIIPVYVHSILLFSFYVIQSLVWQSQRLNQFSFTKNIVPYSGSSHSPLFSSSLSSVFLKSQPVP